MKIYVINIDIQVKNNMKVKKQQKILIERINYLCKQRGMSYYALASKSGVPLTTLLHILDGTTKNPGIFTVFKLCDGFNITITEFLRTNEFKSLQKDVG